MSAELQAQVLFSVWEVGAVTVAELADGLDQAPAAVQQASDALVPEALIELDGELLRPGPDEALARRRFGELLGLAVCRECGCSDFWGCPEGCWWVQDDLCSACAGVGT